MARRRARRWLFIGSVLLVVAVGTFVYSRMDSEPPNIDPSLLATVVRADIARSVVATGYVEPISNKIEIRGKASGIVKHLHVDVGDVVRPGDVLVELDRDQLEAQLREAEANLQAARADVEASLAELERAQILAEDYDVELARSNHKRSIELLEQQLIPQSSFDETGGRLREALNRQRAAAASIGVARAAVTQRRAQVAQVEAAVERIREELSYTTIRSPILGIVLAREVEVGGAVSSILTMGAGATTVLTLGNMGEVYIKGSVAESDIGRIRDGLPARITVQAHRDKVFGGQVYMIAPLGREQDNVTSFEVRISVENPEGLLLAAMSANAEIILEEHRNVLTIPEGALIYDQERNARVEVPDPTGENGRRRVAVKTDITTGTRAEIVEGLAEGDEVILQ